MIRHTFSGLLCALSKPVLLFIPSLSAGAVTQGVFLVAHLRHLSGKHCATSNTTKIGGGPVRLHVFVVFASATRGVFVVLLTFEPVKFTGSCVTISTNQHFAHSLLPEA